MPQYNRLTNSQIQEINKKNGITIQGFPGLFDKGVHTRFSKRIDFDLPNQKDISEEYVRDMQEKMARTQRDFTFNRETEVDFIKSVKDQIIGENRRKYELLMRKRDEFVRDNSVKRKEKQDKEQRDRQEYKEYKLNFFPFTYGEEVEHHQAKLRDGLKEDY